MFCNIKTQEITHFLFKKTVFLSKKGEIACSIKKKLYLCNRF